MYVVAALVAVLLFLIVTFIILTYKPIVDLSILEKIEIDKLIEGVDFVLVDGIRKDPKEFDPKYRGIITKVENEASKFFHNDMFWFDIWAYMKKKLKEKYDIDWRSLAELNPEHTFD